MPPPLGWIEPAQRTPAQHAAHATAMATIQPVRHFGLPMPVLARGQKVLLTNAWKDPKVIADTGYNFARKHQFTGSCVDAGGWNALVTSICMQRVAGPNPTRAFVPFTYHNYAHSRHLMGDDSEGEGSMGSTYGKSLEQIGVRDWLSGGEGMPAFQHDESDGFRTDGRTETHWSSWRSPDIQKILPVAGQHLLGKAVECKTVEDIRTLNLNGIGVAFACNNYIGNASIQGSGDDAVVVGYWDGRGGHQQSVHGVYEHPNLGPLYWAQNNWDANTYPKDPAGGPVCGCWVLEKKLESALKNLDAEVFGYTHVPWILANPDVVTWSQLW